MPTTPPQPPGARPPGPPAHPGLPQRTSQPCPRPAARPLPDPAGVRLYTVPDSAPPYDDEVLPPTPPASDYRSAGHTSAAGHRAADAQCPDAQGPDAHRPGDRDESADGTRPADSTRPAWPGQFAQVLVETLAGSRPPRQMTTWTTQRARARIQRLGPALAAGQRPQLRRVVAFRPAADVIEMTVVVSFGPRTRALAVRLEHTAPRRPYPGHQPTPGRWLCTEVEAA
jgi:hypothetical protein